MYAAFAASSTPIRRAPPKHTAAAPRRLQAAPSTGHRLPVRGGRGPFARRVYGRGTEPASRRLHRTAPRLAESCLNLGALLRPARDLLWPRHPRGRPASLRGLPLVEERAENPGRTLAFVFTGDGN